MRKEKPYSVPSAAGCSDRDKASKKKRRCSYCGAEAPLVWVHGHGQCAECGINVQECCQGERCGRKYIKE